MVRSIKKSRSYPNRNVSTINESKIIVTPDLYVLLSWGSTVMSFHSRQSLSVSSFQVSLGLPAPCLPSIWISHAVLIAPLEPSTCPNQRSLLSLSKWGWGPQAQALPVIRLTLPWPRPLAWYCRSVWSWPYHCPARAGSSWSVAKFHWHGAWHSARKNCTHGHVSCKRGGGMWELVVAPWTSSRLFYLFMGWGVKQNKESLICYPKIIGNPIVYLSNCFLFLHINLSCNWN